MPDIDPKQNPEFRSQPEEIINTTDGVDTPFNEPNNISVDQRQVRHAEDFFNNYGVLSPDQLYELSKDSTPEGRARLAEIAEHYDIPMTPGSDPQEVIQKIIVAMDSDDSPNPIIP